MTVSPKAHPSLQPHSTGLGLRRDLMNTLLEHIPEEIDFFEVAPENWHQLGGGAKRKFEKLIQERPLYCHGLSLSLGGPTPIDTDFVKEVGTFLDTFNVPVYSEHLSYCTDDGHLYDLMPIPFTQEAVSYVAARIRQVQDILERRIAIENVSFYAMPGMDLTEIEFINAVLEEADCDLLLDVNNIYVNSINHGAYNPNDFIAAMPAGRVQYLHVAGHYREEEGLIVDTHGAPVIGPVWTILEQAYKDVGIKPTLLERDFNFPPLSELVEELNMIRAIQTRVAKEQGHDRQAQTA